MTLQSINVSIWNRRAARHHANSELMPTPGPPSPSADLLTIGDILIDSLMTAFNTHVYIDRLTQSMGWAVVSVFA